MGALRLFYVRLGDTAERFDSRYDTVPRDLRSARFGVTYRTYMARTYLYALVVGVVTLVLSAVVAAYSPLTSENPLLWLTPFGVGVGTAIIVHEVRVLYPGYVANVRAERIEASLPGVTSFMYALVRGGVPLSEVLDTVSGHPEVFGEAAEEMGVASRDVERFGADVVTALQRLSDDTPSDELSDFLKSFVSIIIRKDDLSDFLGEKADDFHDEAEARQESVLERLGVLAEFYVVVFVAAPLFVITILVVIGFIGAATLVSLRIFVYVLMPFSGIGFIILLDVLFEPPSRPDEEPSSDVVKPVVEDTPRREERFEGAEEASDALDLYDRRRRYVNYFRSPFETLKRRPQFALYVGAVSALLYVAVKAGFFLQAEGVPAFEFTAFSFAFTETTELIIRTVDDTIVEAAMILLFVYALSYQVRAEYLRDIQERLPELLGRLSNINRAGVPFLQSLVSLREANLGVLNEDIGRLGHDVTLNATAGDALKRFDERVKSPAITRTTVLLTETSEASGRLGRVLEIAERDASLRRRLARQRRDRMSLYTVVIYVSFVIFVVIIAVLDTVFIPALPSDPASGLPQMEGGFSPQGFQTVFYHAAVVQAVLSGLIAGKMTSGRVSTGAKHAFIMVAIAYLTFNFFLVVV